MIRKIALYLVISISMIFIAAFCLIQTPYFKRYMIDVLKHKIKDQSGWTLQIDQIHGVLPFYCNVTGIVLTDKEEQHLFTLDSVNMTFFPHALILGKLCCCINQETLLVHLEMPLKDPHPITFSASGHWKENDHFLFQGRCEFYEGSLKTENLQLTLHLPSQNIAEPIVCDLSVHMKEHHLRLQMNSAPILISDENIIENFEALISIDTQQMHGIATALCQLNEIPVEIDFCMNHTKETDTMHISQFNLRVPQGTLHGNGFLDKTSQFFQAHLEAEGNIATFFETPSHQSLQAAATMDITCLEGLWHTKLQAHGEIASILQLLFKDDNNAITGVAALTVETTQHKEGVQITGSIDVTDASYEFLSTGAVLKNIHAVFEGDDKQLILKQLSGSDGKEGLVTATGVLFFDPTTHFPFELSIDLKNTVIVHLDYARGIGSGFLTLKGDLKEASLVGKITIDEARITLPDHPPPALKMMPVTYINLPYDETLPQHCVAKESDWPLHLDIQLIIPHHAFIRGRNLFSEWRGDIHLIGNADCPLLYGSAHVINGEYSFNGKAFLSKQGNITFSGDPAHKISLYILAIHDSDDIRVEAIFKGSISDPKLTFHSNPPMNEKEILSWILFNKGLREITPFEGEELNQSIITLSSGNSGEDLLSQLRRGIGIDRVDISSNDTGERHAVSVRVGKYLTKGLFVSLNKGINNEANQVAIEARLSKRLKIEAELGDNAEGKLHLKWKRDY